MEEIDILSGRELTWEEVKKDGSGHYKTGEVGTRQMLTAHINREGAGWTIDIRGPEFAGEKFFVGRINFAQTQYSPDFWKALAFFLAKERTRHKLDIANIDADMLKLKEMGIEIHEPDSGEFIKVP